MQYNTILLSFLFSFLSFISITRGFISQGGLMQGERLLSPEDGKHLDA